MSIQENHIGTAYWFLKTVAENIGANYAHGEFSDEVVLAQKIYPFMHIAPVSVIVSERTTQVTFNIALRDQMTLNTTENEGLSLATIYAQSGYTNDENYAQILQSLYVDFVREIAALEMDHFNNVNVQRPFSMLPVIDSGSDVIAGYDITVTLTIRGVLTIDGRC